jgi:hypothetical protein
VERDIAMLDREDWLRTTVIGRAVGSISDEWCCN